jgi:hypothetical protein
VVDLVTFPTTVKIPYRMVAGGASDRPDPVHSPDRKEGAFRVTRRSLGCCPANAQETGACPTCSINIQRPRGLQPPGLQGTGQIAQVVTCRSLWPGWPV